MTELKAAFCRPHGLTWHAPQSMTQESVRRPPNGGYDQLEKLAIGFDLPMHLGAANDDERRSSQAFHEVNIGFLLNAMSTRNKRYFMRGAHVTWAFQSLMSDARIILAVMKAKAKLMESRGKLGLFSREN